MKKIAIACLCGGIFVTLTACSVLEGGLPLPTTGGTTAPALTNTEVISGLKEALSVGITNSVNLTSITDGFLSNANIRLPFPPDALKVRTKALELGLDNQVEKFETTLNRAAEEATKEALPIFKDAILGMSVTDGFAILKGGNGAATKFLKDNTTNKLVEAFSPKVANAISTVKLTEYWNPIITKYNQLMTISGGEKLNPDLNKYVTERAVSGLYFMVEQEENKIRLDPVARVSDLLKKVFGSVN
jgi:hypothetical protein